MTDLGLVFGEKRALYSQFCIQVPSVYLFPFLSCQQHIFTMACEQRRKQGPLRSAAMLLHQLVYSTQVLPV